MSYLLASTETAPKINRELSLKFGQMVARRKMSWRELSNLLTGLVKM